MAVPTVQVLADFSGGGITGTPSTDISAWVDVVTNPPKIQVGRQDEDDAITPSQATFYLSNADGRFTPGNTAGAYYPNVDVGVHVRINLIVGGTTYNRFDGYVDSWEVSWTGGLQAIVEVNATDILGRFGIDTPLNTVLAEEMIFDAPSLLFPLQEAEGSTSFGDLTGQQAPGIILNSPTGAGVVTAGQTPLGTFIAGTVVGLTNTTGDSALAFPTPATALTAGTLEAWVQMPTSAPITLPLYMLAAYGGPNNAESVQLRLTTTGQVEALITGASGTQNLTSAETYIDGNIHQFAVGFNASGMSLTCDGVPITTSATVGSVTLGSYLFAGITGYSPFGLPGQTVVYGDAFTGAFAYIALWPSLLTSTRLLAHFNAGNNGFFGDSTVTRIGRLLNYRANFGSALTTCSGTMGAQDTANETMQQALFDCGAAEGTVVYINGLGKVALVPRQTSYGITPVVTLDASQTQIDLASTFTTDAQYLVNQVQVSRIDGSDQVVDNTASETKYGIRSQSVTLAVTTDADALNGAAWLVSQGSTTKPRTITLTVDLLTDSSTSHVQNVLTVAPLSLMSLTNLPTAAPASTMSLIAQGWTETVGLNSWNIEYNCSPAISPGVLLAGTGSEANSVLGSYIAGW